jgi:capsular polysaccharide biosynthesis protein
MEDIYMNNEMTLEIREYMNIIKKYKWFIIIVTMLTTISTAVMSFQNPTTNYSTVTTMVPVKVSSEANKQIQSGDVGVNKELMDTYNEILQSNAVAIKASEKLNGDINVDMIKSFYSASSKANTQVLTMQVQTPTPQNTLDIAKAVTESFQEEVQAIYPLTTFKVIDEPQLPKYPISQNKTKQIALGFLLSLLASIVIVLARNYFDTTIRTKRDAEKYLGLPVIGDISRYSTK